MRGTAPPIEARQWWIRAEWPIWRLVADGTATLEEIDRHWTTDDVLDANEVLDVINDVAESRKPQTPTETVKTTVTKGNTPRAPRARGRR